ncbi:MAG TPA: phosphoglycerate kinase [Candidatus Sulfotelmatobacter sp.]|jgi:phosphoglycerate kinase|nr:phosphoglycerate kinase [Candidatus Sulfotelmatobacter sp.]
MKYVNELAISNKTILLRVDFNVSLNPNHSIADDARIQQSIPTIEYLLREHNKLILIAHLGEPKKRNPSDSLKPVAKRLQEYFPHNNIVLIDDFTTKTKHIAQQSNKEIILLENIRFYPGEQANDQIFAKQLASLGEIYVNDAFSVSHRKSASIVGLPKLLPAYGGLLLKKEVSILEKIMRHPKKPFVAIIGGKKIATKIKFIKKLTTVADYILVGGGLANTFFAAEGYPMGKSLISKDDVALAKELLEHAKHKHSQLLLPSDVIIGKSLDSTTSEIRKANEIAKDEEALDIGPETQATFGKVIDEANTIVWNGPAGYMENQEFKRGTDFLYYSITNNNHVTSVIGGGDTLSAISKKEYLDKITHISTGGGAMLEFIENGTLPGIEALKKAQH